MSFPIQIPSAWYYANNGDFSATVWNFWNVVEILIYLLWQGGCSTSIERFVFVPKNENNAQIQTHTHTYIRIFVLVWYAKLWTNIVLVCGYWIALMDIEFTARTNTQSNGMMDLRLPWKKHRNNIRQSVCPCLVLYLYISLYINKDLIEFRPSSTVWGFYHLVRIN